MLNLSQCRIFTHSNNYHFAVSWKNSCTRHNNRGGNFVSRRILLATLSDYCISLVDTFKHYFFFNGIGLSCHSWFISSYLSSLNQKSICRNLHSVTNDDDITNKKPRLMNADNNSITNTINLNKKVTILRCSETELKMANYFYFW
jgi:hypothetical protein